MQKFFVESNQINDEEIKIINDDVNHISNVLRLEDNEEILIGNKNTGETYLCRITSQSKNEILTKIIKKKEQSTEPNTYIHLFQGLPKSDKMEYIIQKCTEIGVSEITPVMMSRCISKVDEKENLKKNIRWQKIAQSAAEQSKRDIIPKINLVKNFKNIFEILEKYDIVLVAYENETKNILKDVLQKNDIKHNNIAVIIGPEGGIDEKEIEDIIKFGGKCITLGKRILRTETAPLVISSAILYEFNDMN